MPAANPELETRWRINLEFFKLITYSASVVRSGVCYKGSTKDGRKQKNGTELDPTLRAVRRKKCNVCVACSGCLKCRIIDWSFATLRFLPGMNLISPFETNTVSLFSSIVCPPTQRYIMYASVILQRIQCSCFFMCECVFGAFLRLKLFCVTKWDSTQRIKR